MDIMMQLSNTSSDHARTSDARIVRCSLFIPCRPEGTKKRE
jgi:hypothetical protein